MSKPQRSENVSRRVLLETWLRETYGDDAPDIATARRWCRKGKIYPAPEKHGRSYFVHPEARYTDKAGTSLLDRIRSDEAKTPYAHARPTR